LKKLSSPPSPPDVVLPHALTMSPIFPLEVGKNPPKSIQQEFPVAFGRGLGSSPPLAKPSWQPIMSVHRDFYFPQDYQAQALSNDMTAPVLPPNTPTVSRSISCLTVEKVHQQYLAMADTAGFVTLYSMYPLLVEVTRVETTHAAEREYQEQWLHHRLILQNSKKPKTGMALVTGTAAASTQQHPAFDRFQDTNVIQAMTFSQTLLVLATLREIECWTVSSTASLPPQRLWTHTWNLHYEGSNCKATMIMCPLRLDLATVGNSNVDCCLASFFLGNNHVKDDITNSSSTPSPLTQTQHSPLWLLTPASESLPSPRVTEDLESITPLSEQQQKLSTACDSSQVTAIQLHPLVDGKVPKFGPHCTAIWDAFHNEYPRILMTALVIGSDGDCKSVDQSSATLDDSNANPRNSQLAHRRQELWLVEYRSPDYVVTQRATLLSKTNLKAPPLEATLCQVNSQFTLVACSKGIRLYETDTLHLLQVYGEHLALHGQSVMWQDVLVCPRWQFQDPEIRAANTDRIGARVIRPDVIEYSDYLSSKNSRFSNGLEHKEQSSDATEITSSDGNGQCWLDEGRAWIIGVPHADRGPRELCETLHVWDWCRGDCKTPAFTVAGPSARSKGIQSLVLVAGGNEDATTKAVTGTNMRLILCTKSGDCREYAPTARSDWPGIMFPPDYHVVAENLEYIEDEGELDIFGDEASAEDDENDDEDDMAQAVQDPRQDREDEALLAEAMQRSVHDMSVEWRRSEVEGGVVVVDGKTPTRPNMEISCHPEPYLRQTIHLEPGISQSDNGLNQKMATGAQNHVNTSNTSPLAQLLPRLPQLELVIKQVHGQLERPPFQPLGISVEQTPSETASHNSCNNGKNGKGGKRSRAANLEALLKASINPVLRRLMLAKDKVWADGLASLVRSQDRRGKRRLVPQKEKDGLDGSSIWRVHAASREEETALALGLLHLSPAKPSAIQGASILHSNGFVDSVERFKKSAPCTNDSAAAGGASCFTVPCVTSESENGFSPIDSSQSSMTAPKISRLNSVSETVNGMDFTSKHINPGDNISSLHRLSARNPLTEHGSLAAYSLDSATDRLCDACGGRMTFHICGSRALPIDFDALRQAEGEQKRKEEEDKRKAIAEKRRAAAARRKETKLRKQPEPCSFQKDWLCRPTPFPNSEHDESRALYQTDPQQSEEYQVHREPLVTTFSVLAQLGDLRQNPEKSLDAEVHVDFPLPSSFAGGSDFLNESVKADSDSKLVTAHALAALAAFADPNRHNTHADNTSHNETKAAAFCEYIVDPTMSSMVPNSNPTTGRSCAGASCDGLTSSDSHPSSGHGFILPPSNEIITGKWNDPPGGHDMHGVGFGVSSDFETVGKQCM
jgi:hypothetical protein